MIPPSRCVRSASQRARTVAITVAITESVRSPMILLRCHAGAGSGAERPLPEGGIIPPLLALPPSAAWCLGLESNHALGPCLEK